MSWIKLAMGAFMTKDIVEAGKPLSDEIEGTVITFQVRSGAVMTIPTEAAPVCTRMGFLFLGVLLNRLELSHVLCEYIG